MKSRPWIVAHDGRQGADAMAMECLRCGAKQLPASVWPDNAPADYAAEEVAKQGLLF